jgi:hypothetical protein
VNPLLLLPVVAQLRQAVVGRSVERVLPVARRGLHLALAGGPSGLRLDTRPAGGALLPLGTGPPRLRGGRSAWPDATAAADRDLAGAPISGVWIAPGLGTLRIALAGVGDLVWRGGAEPSLGIHLSGQRGRGLPAGADPPDPAGRTVLDDLGAAADALERWLEGARAEADLSALLPGLDGAAADAVLDAAFRRPAALRRWIASLRGSPLRVGVAAAADGGFRIDPFPPSVDEDAAQHAAPASDIVELPEALARWYETQLALEDRRARRQRAAQLLKGERKRVDRALSAVARDAEKAGDPAALRHRANALLAAGPGAASSPDGRGWQVSDPWQPEVVIDVPADPPGASLHQTAERLYARAKRAERGVEARRERRAALERRRDALQALRERLDGAAGEDPAGLDAVEEELERLGLAARDEHAEASAPAPTASKAPARSGRRKKPGPQPSQPARTFTSPSGFRVLVGRSARQNDVVTFKVAAPEDLWLHARERAGAHVVIRTAGAREVPDEDVRFAAELAAAWSRAPVGEPVEVHVARRKHVRKAKGAPAGQVAVRKSWTVRVVTPRAPSSDDSPA